jgi:hypothetical protein
VRDEFHTPAAPNTLLPSRDGGFACPLILSLMCNAIKWSFATAYLVLLAIGTWSFLSADRDHFPGSLLLRLGLPWTLFLDSFGKSDSLTGVSPVVLTILAPAINVAILFSICSTLRRRRTLSSG